MTKMTTKRLAVLVMAVDSFTEERDAAARFADSVGDHKTAAEHREDQQAAYSALAAVLDRFPQQRDDLMQHLEENREK